VRKVNSIPKYYLIHERLRRFHKKPNECSNCGVKNRVLDWANVTGEYDENIKNYTALCRYCHGRLDSSGAFNKCVNGHTMTKKNTYIRKGTLGKECRIRKKETLRQWLKDKRDLL